MLIALLSLALLGTSQGTGILFENIAPTLGVASQIDTATNYARAALAIDGNTNGKWVHSEANTIMHTKSVGAKVWWQVDFPQLVYIDRIVIWNRMDCCQSRLSNTRVLVDGKEVGKVAVKAGQASYEIAVGFKGKNVKLWQAANSVMNIAEVEVFGSVIKPQTEPPVEPTEPPVEPTEPPVEPTEPTTLAVEFKAKKPKLKCKTKKGCSMQFKLSGADFDASTAKVMICQLVDGVEKNCKITKEKKGWYGAKIGSKKSTPASAAGQWVCTAVIGEKKAVSDPATVTIK